MVQYFYDNDYFFSYLDQCRGLLTRGVAGLHFYTMNRSRSTREILTRLKQDHLL